MESGKTYHIFNRGNNREVIFYTERNYYYFLELFYKYLGDYTEVYAYCLMPNHFHFMLRIKEEEEISSNLLKKNFDVSTNLSEKFRCFFISYAQAINRQEKRTGSLFQKNFKRKEVQEDSYFSELIAYIHLNPVKAGLSENCKNWKFSSYNTIINYWETRILRKEVLNWFGGRREFLDTHENMKENWNKNNFELVQSKRA